MGMTTAELGKQLKAGKILAKDMVPKLAKALRELAAPGLEKALNSLTTTEQRMLNTWVDFKNQIFTSGLGSFLGGLYTTFGNLLILLKPLGSVIGGIFDGIQDILYPVQYSIALFLDWAEAMGFLDVSTQNWSKDTQDAFKQVGEVIGWVLGVWGISKIGGMVSGLLGMLGVIGKVRTAFVGMLGAEAAASAVGIGGAAASGAGAASAGAGVAGAGLGLAGAGVVALGGAGLAYNLLNPQTVNQTAIANKDYLSNMAKQNQNPLPWLNTNQIGSVGAFKQTEPVTIEVVVKGDVIDQRVTTQLSTGMTSQ